MTTQTNIKAESIQTSSSATQSVVQPVRASAGLKIKTQVKAGGLYTNHNEKLVTAPAAAPQSPPSAGLKIKTQVKAGAALANHNEKLVATPTAAPQSPPSAGLKIKTQLKAGGLKQNHNESLRSVR